jgi:hypothetical protein
VVDVNHDKTVGVLTDSENGSERGLTAAAGRYLATAWLDHTIRIYDARALLGLGVIQDPTAVIGVTCTPEQL